MALAVCGFLRQLTPYCYKCLAPDSLARGMKVNVPLSPLVISQLRYCNVFCTWPLFRACPCQTRAPVPISALS